MGHCISIQVGPQANKSASQQSIKNHKRKGERLRRNRAEESSDAETDEDVQDLNRHPSDPNFGQAQSPINLITTSASEYCATPMATSDIAGNPLRFNYPDTVRECSIINTGHTVQVNVPDHSKCSVTINGKQYGLKQFHFHTPSEHMVDGKQFEMEMHLVHINEDGEIAVLGFIFTTQMQYVKANSLLGQARKQLIRQTQAIIKRARAREEHPVHQDEDYELDKMKSLRSLRPDDEEEEWDEDNELALVQAESRTRGESFVPGNDFLEQFWDQLPMKKTEEAVPLKNAISFDYLFECASKKFKADVGTNEIELDLDIFEYPGSLTTPPFTEGVHWMVSKKLNFINVKQLNKLSSCWGHHGNARECQEYCGRKVEVRNTCAVKGYFMG